MAEYFFASDASAIVEHTNRVIYLEDDDVAAVCDNGALTIHRISRSSSYSCSTYYCSYQGCSVHFVVLSTTGRIFFLGELVIGLV